MTTWEFSHQEDVSFTWRLIRARNGSEVGRLHIRDITRRDIWELDQWLQAMVADWREREAS
jgi:hypothetical protein